MKNKKYRTLLAVALITAMVGGTTGSLASVRAEEGKNNITVTQDENSDKEMKSETVFVQINGNGDVKKVIVSDQLKNIRSDSLIDDQTLLKDIENLKGDETFTIDGKKINWKGDGKDICYQGTTNKPLPVKVKISYQLDGKDISEEELIGKSGHLKVRYQYEYTNEEKKFIPFLMLSGVMIDSSKITDVQVTEGNHISDGDREVIIGGGIPGLMDELDVEDIDFPTGIEFEGNVNEFESLNGVTLVSNEIFNHVDVDDIDSIDDLKASMYELQDAANQLLDGSALLKDGMQELLTKSGEMISGIDELADGGNKLKDGSKDLKEGSLALVSGTTSLIEGTGQLTEGTKVLSGGLKQVQEGAKSAAEGSSRLNEGAEQLNQGVLQLQASAGEGLTKLNGGVDTLKGGIEQSAAGAEQLSQGLGGAVDGAASLKDGIASAASGADQIAIGAGRLKGLMSQVRVDFSQTIGSLEKLKESLPIENRLQIDQIILGLKAQEQIYNGALGQAVAGIGEIETNTANLAYQLGENGQIGEGVSSLYNGLTELKGGADALAGGLGNEILGGVSTLQAGSREMSMQLQEGAGQLANGSAGLVKGTKDLGEGLGSLQAGADQVYGGSVALSENMAKADEGARALADGSKKLDAGLDVLGSGAITLNNGLLTLKDGSGMLTDGVTKLSDGAGDLNKGMIQFKEEGIDQLVSVFGGDVDKLITKVKNVFGSSKEYKNYAGINDKMDGDVKFIFIQK